MKYCFIQEDVSHRLVFVEILMCGHNGCPNGLRANASKFGHLTLGYRPLLTVIQTLSSIILAIVTSRTWTQNGINYIFLLRFVVKAPRPYCTVDLPFHFLVASFHEGGSNPNLPAKSSTAAKLIDARSPPTPYPNSPSAVRHRGTQFELLLPSFDV